MAFKNLVVNDKHIWPKARLERATIVCQTRNFTRETTGFQAN